MEYVFEPFWNPESATGLALRFSCFGGIGHGARNKRRKGTVCST